MSLSVWGRYIRESSDRLSIGTEKDKLDPGKKKPSAHSTTEAGTISCKAIYVIRFLWL
jgi:hypothetical protein